MPFLCADFRLRDPIQHCAAYVRRSAPESLCVSPSFLLLGLLWNYVSGFIVSVWPSVGPSLSFVIACLCRPFVYLWGFKIEQRRRFWHDLEWKQTDDSLFLKGKTKQRMPSIVTLLQHKK